MSAPFEIGQAASLSKKITAEDVGQFSDLSGDLNPVHLDPDYAAKTIFGRPIAHGLYVASFISATIANRLPGPGTIYLGQELQFRKPVYIGDEITARVTVSEFPKPGMARLTTVCVNQNGEVVIQGSALVKLPAGDPSS